MLTALDQALRSVPMLQTLGIRAEEARPGHLVLRLPYGTGVTNHAGAIHTSAIFAVGELAAAVALATHPELAGYVQLQKSTKIKYYASSQHDVTAHARITAEMVVAAVDQVAGGSTRLDVPVQVFDGHGSDVAELISRFTLRMR
ncbi:MAG: DUF4442 domain-containing protein [Myxococcota bacterium]